MAYYSNLLGYLFIIVLSVKLITSLEQDYSDFDRDESLKFVGPSIREAIATGSIAETTLNTFRGLMADIVKLPGMQQYDKFVFQPDERKSLAQQGMSVELDGMLSSSSLSPDISLPPDITLPDLPKVGLNATCNNKLSDMAYYLFSCKTFNFGIRKKCAGYLVGALYASPNYPAPVQFYEAPSPCLTEYLTFFLTVLKSASGSGDGLQKLIYNYLAVNFETNACGRHCYQNFQKASNDFYLSCFGELVSQAKTYPLLFLFQDFQEFRNQACDRNAANQTCFALVSSMIPPIPTPPTPPATPIVVKESTEVKETATVESVSTNTVQSSFQSMVQDRVQTLMAANTANAIVPAASAAASKPPALFNDFYCNYYNESLTTPNADLAQLNYEVFVKSCQLFSVLGCCTGTLFQMLQQNQVSLLATKSANLIPPCWLNYLQFNCPTTSLSTMCSKGSIASQTTIVGNFSLTNTVPLLFPNMYNQTSIVLTQEILTLALAELSLSAEPYHFLPTYPFQVMLIGYTYFDLKGKALTGTYPGQMYYPYGGDYKIARKGVFTFMITMQNLSPMEVQYVKGALQSQEFAAILSSAFKQPGTFVTTSSKIPKYVAAEPTVLPANSAWRISDQSAAVVMMSMMMGMAVLLWT